MFGAEARKEWRAGCVHEASDADAKTTAETDRSTTRSRGVVRKVMNDFASPRKFVNILEQSELLFVQSQVHFLLITIAGLCRQLLTTALERLV